MLQDTRRVHFILLNTNYEGICSFSKARRKKSYIEQQLMLTEAQAWLSAIKFKSLFKQSKEANNLKLVQTTVHSVREVWGSALRRSIPAWLVMKTKQGNGS